MSDTIKAWLLFLGLFLVTVSFVSAIRHYARRHLLDLPNHRSSHRFPTPRGGGLACVLGFLLSALYFLYRGILSQEALGLLGVGLLLAAIGFWDDHRPLSALWRLLMQVCAALLAMICMHGMPLMKMPWMTEFTDLGLFGYALGALLLSWTLNLFNFMDGIDGIAASEATFVAAGLAGFMWGENFQLALLSASLAVVSAGFLVWNWPPAKIFMGDVGSYFIGFMLGGLILLFSHKNFNFILLD